MARVQSALAVSGAVGIGAGVGSSHACAVLGSGQVVCWGDNSIGQLGNGSSLPLSDTPVIAVGIHDAVAVAAGQTGTCAVRATGEVACWGYGGQGQLGNGTFGSSNVPTAVQGIDDAVAIHLGTHHACAIRANRRIVCWGLGNSGQLGNGNSTNSSVPVEVSGIDDAVAVAGGAFFTCAVRASGDVNCWGVGDQGRLGNGGSTSSSVPVAVVGLHDAIGVATGLSSACAVRSGGAVACWGDGSLGRLGNGTFTTSAIPVPVTGLVDAVAVAAGTHHLCARRATGEAACWGLGLSGALGNGTNVVSAVPLPVVGLTDATAIAAGLHQSCATRAAGGVVCWGERGGGELGDGLSLGTNHPVDVFGLADARASLSTSRYQSCAARASGPLVCWGKEAWGIGAGGLTLPPTAMPVGGSVVSVAVGSSYGCAVRDDGTAACWGFGGDGQLGNGSLTNSADPVAVSGLTDAVAVAVGPPRDCVVLAGGVGFCFDHTCALRATGQIACWGDNGYGRLGDGSGSNRSAVPVMVSGLTDARAVTLGFLHTCALRETGAVVCWGNGASGQLGDGSMSHSSVPVTVAGLDDAVAIAAGTSDSCAVRETGQVVCWGVSGGNISSSGVPVVVPGISDALSIASGRSHTCVVRATGGVACWGIGTQGQLGQGKFASSAVPVNVVGLEDAIAVAGGESHTCAVRSTGGVVCWGTGSLGIELFSNVPVPLAEIADNAGTTCVGNSDCTSGICADRVCCRTDCGNDASDCRACSVAAGGTEDGTCTPRSAGLVCSPSRGPCDQAEACDGVGLTCPADRKQPKGTACREASGSCDLPETCGGTSDLCPSDAFAAAGTVCFVGDRPCDGLGVCPSCVGCSAAPACEIPTPPPMCDSSTTSVSFRGRRLLRLSTLDGAAQERTDDATFSGTALDVVGKPSPYSSPFDADDLADANATVSSHVDGTAQVGTLAATVVVRAAAGDTSPYDPDRTRAEAYGDLDWSDQVTVTCAAPPCPATVRLLLLAELENTYVNVAGAPTALVLASTSAVRPNGVMGTANLSNTLASPANSGSGQWLLTTAVGETLTVKGHLRVQAQAPLTAQDVSVTLDAGHTARVRLIPLDPGVSYTTASGRGLYVADSTAPVATLEAPPEGAHVRGAVDVIATATDDLSGVARIDVTANGTLLGRCTGPGPCPDRCRHHRPARRPGATGGDRARLRGQRGRGSRARPRVRQHAAAADVAGRRRRNRHQRAGCRGQLRSASSGRPERSAEPELRAALRCLLPRGHDAGPLHRHRPRRQCGDRPVPGDRPRRQHRPRRRDGQRPQRSGVHRRDGENHRQLHRRRRRRHGHAQLHAELDDGASTAGTVSESKGRGTCAGSHVYAGPGAYVVEVTVTDSRLATGSGTFQVLVVDPSGASVAGIGSVDTPAGGYPAKAKLTGKGRFAFVTGLRTGSSAPRGQTTFDFEAAGMRFRSTGLDSLGRVGRPRAVPRLRHHQPRRRLRLHRHGHRRAGARWRRQGSAAHEDLGQG